MHTQHRLESSAEGRRPKSVALLEPTLAGRSLATTATAAELLLEIKAMVSELRLGTSTIAPMTETRETGAVTTTVLIATLVAGTDLMTRATPPNEVLPAENLTGDRGTVSRLACACTSCIWFENCQSRTLGCALSWLCTAREQQQQQQSHRQQALARNAVGPPGSLKPWINSLTGGCSYICTDPQAGKMRSVGRRRSFRASRSLGEITRRAIERKNSDNALERRDTLSQIQKLDTTQFLRLSVFIRTSDHS